MITLGQKPNLLQFPELSLFDSTEWTNPLFVASRKELPFPGTLSGKQSHTLGTVPWHGTAASWVTFAAWVVATTLKAVEERGLHIKVMSFVMSLDITNCPG